MNGLVGFDAAALVYAIAAIICAGLLSFALTPAVRVLAFKINAIDTPRDGRRMHSHAMESLTTFALLILG